MPGKKNRTSTGDDQGREKGTPHEAPDGFTNEPPPPYTGCTFADLDDTTLGQMSDEQMDEYIKQLPAVFDIVSQAAFKRISNNYCKNSGMSPQDIKTFTTNWKSRIEVLKQYHNHCAVVIQRRYPDLYGGLCQWFCRSLLEDHEETIQFRCAYLRYRPEDLRRSNAPLRQVLKQVLCGW